MCQTSTPIRSRFLRKGKLINLQIVVISLRMQDIVCDFSISTLEKGLDTSSAIRPCSKCELAHTEKQNDCDEGFVVQHVYIGRVEGRELAYLCNSTEDADRFFDELFMLAADGNHKLDHAKWCQKGYYAFFKSTPVTCETMHLVRKVPALQEAWMSMGCSAPPPTTWKRSRHSGTSSVLHINKS